MTAISTLRAGRAAAEALMVDTCTITRAGAGVVVYRGKCRMQTATARPPQVEAGMQTYAWNVLDLLAHLPVVAPDLLDGDQLTVTSSVMNPHLTGRTLRVRAMITPKSFETKRIAVMSQISATFLPDTITVLSAPVITDAYGNRVLDWANPTRTTVAALVQPTSSTEALGTGDRDQVVSHFQVWVEPDTAVSARDRIEWSGLTLSVDGEPQPVTDTSGVPHHKVFTATISKG